MKKRIIAAVLAAVLACSLILQGCQEINLSSLQSQLSGILDNSGTSQSSKSSSSKKSSGKNSSSKKSSNKSSSSKKSSNKSSSSKKSSSKNSSKSSSSKKSSGKSSAVKSSAAGSYTMSDVKKLKNTGNFAKNTLEHIFDGTINSKGKATGYHYDKISDSKGSIISGTKSEPDENGVYTAKVKVGSVTKNGFSSFYPDDWTPQQVVDAINTAYENALSDKSNPHGELWIGWCDDFEIDMYLNSSKKITTAYPIYEGD